MKTGMKPAADSAHKYQRLPKVHTTHNAPTDPTSTPPGQASRCPKLSRYKRIGAVFLVVVTLVLMGVTCLQWRQPYMASCLQDPVVRDALMAHETRKGGMGHLRYSHTKRRLPQCLIIGARKAGTRALLYFLNLHTQIQTAGREIHFFDKHYEQGLEWYRKQMPFSFKDQITIEKSPAYFVEQDVPGRVYAMNQTVKLLLIIRDPIDRTMSDYLQIMDNKLKRQKSVIPFEKLVLDEETYEINRSYTAIKRSIYVRHLQRWLQYFPRSQFHIVDGDNMITRPWEELSKVENFLGLDHQITHDRFTFNTSRGFFCFRSAQTEHCLAEGKGRPHPVIDPYTLKKLKEFFTPFNEKLFDRVGRKFNWRHWM
ncbi:heparan sulfate glucosamine 3-O-sulfotransferase 5-like [Littorina saxatilis]|uniref:Sulfotransferase domain-containing protein n=1 Tax=Littorina saxatilis TaxID=31220 RepID=A0AAN9B5S6_9CAEN